MGMKTTAGKSIDIDKAAAILGTTRAKATSRLAALGYTEECSRCGGSGRYSWNNFDGDRCFGCRGSGRKLVRLTEALASEAKARIEAGELADYFARAAARAAIKGAVARVTEIWRESFTATAYTALSLHPDVPAAVVVRSPEYRAMTLVNALWEACNAIERTARGCTDPVAALASIDALGVLLARVDGEFKAFAAEHGLTAE